MDYIGKDVRGIWKKKQPCAGKAPESPISSHSLLVGIARSEREKQGYPGQKKVPGKKAVMQVSGPDDPRGHQGNANAGGHQQSEHGHSRFSFECQSQ